MEISSILTSNKELDELFRGFLINYKYLRFDGIDGDTYYFRNKKQNKYEIFYDNNNDLEYEFRCNFTPESISFIKEYFKERQFFLINVSFKNKVFFLKLFKDFIDYLIRENKVDVSEIIMDDAFEGVMLIDNKGNINKVKM